MALRNTLGFQTIMRPERFRKLWGTREGAGADSARGIPGPAQRGYDLAKAGC